MLREFDVFAAALVEEFGIEIKVLGNFVNSMQALYRARRQNPDFETIQIYKSPTEADALWLVKNDSLRKHEPPKEDEAKPVKHNPTGNIPLSKLLGDF